MKKSKSPSLITRMIENAQSVEDYVKIQEALKNSDLVPNHAKDMVGPIDIALIIDHGLTLGFDWHVSLQNLIPLAGGMFVMKGDAAKGLVMSRKNVTEWKEYYEGSYDEQNLHCKIVAVVDGIEVSGSFGLKDAIAAGLWDPTSSVKTWYDAYPKRTIKYRALGYLLRDAAPDILKGILLEEEMRDQKSMKITNENGHEITPASTRSVAETKKAEEKLLQKVGAASAPNEMVSESKSVEVKDPHWFYNPDSDTLFIDDKSKEDHYTGANCYMLGAAVTHDIEEGRSLRDSYHDSDSKTDLTYGQYHESVKDLKSAELQEKIAQDYPGAVKFIEMIDQKKTPKAILSLMEPYIDEGEDAALMYLQKTFPDYFERVKQEKVSAQAPPAQAPPAQAPPAQAPETSSDTLESNVLGLPIDPLVDGTRDLNKTTHEVYLPLLRNRKVHDYMDDSLVKGKVYEDMDEMFRKASADFIHRLINEAVEAVK